MEPDIDEIAKIWSVIVSRKHIVEVCSFLFLYGPKDSEKATVRQQTVRSLSHSRGIRLSDMSSV